MAHKNVYLFQKHPLELAVFKVKYSRKSDLRVKFDTKPPKL